MPDRVKEAVFGMLGSHYDCPGALPPLHVADVFAGSGSMGLEALSRGAASCCFFERDALALDALQKNLQALGIEREVTVVTGDAWQAAVDAPDGPSFDLVLLDPPYGDSLDPSNRGAVRGYLRRLGMGGHRQPLVVLHHPAKVHFVMAVDDPWRVIHERCFGTHAVTLFAR